MRISTSAFNAAAVSDMERAQTTLSKTQNQLATGKRVNSPADDPVAAVKIQEYERAKQESTQFGQNSDAARNRLSLEAQALTDATNTMQQVRELAVQASNSAALTDSDRQSIATQIDGLRQSMLDIANRKDSNGEYLFAGFTSQAQPFARNGSGSVQYAGDQGVRQLQITPSQTIADGDSGFSVFMNIPEGNGTFTVKPVAGNTGDAVVGTDSVLNKAAWVPGSYTLKFSTPTDYTIVDSSNVVVATGTYASGSAISFNGVQFTLSGTPAPNDSFAIAPAGREDVFAMFDNLSSALSTPTTTAAQRAALTSAMGATLSQIDQTIDHLTTTSASVGTRLNALDTTDNARSDADLLRETSLSKIRDVDYASAVSSMNQQLVGLQAAQASYARISRLSLFDYIS
jgi:flagellar hook-associated protein 3 FlgL